VQCYSCCCRSSFYSLGRENSNHPGTAFQDAFDRPTETPSRESASHQMIHCLMKAGFASSFPLADAAGELM
jgi:phage-related protein